MQRKKEKSRLNTTIGKRLSKARKKLDLTQLDIAHLIGLTKGQISRIESGKSRLANTVALAIEHKLGIRKDWLYTGKGKMLIKSYEKLERELAQTKKAVSDLEVDLANLPEKHKMILKDLIGELQRG